MVGKVHVEHDRARKVRERETETVLGVVREQNLKIELSRELREDVRERLVVLHHEKQAAFRVQMIAIVDGRGVLRRQRSRRTLSCNRRREPLRRFGRQIIGEPRTRVGERQGQRERAALADFALDGEIAAEEAREVSRDGEPEPGAAELPVRRAVGLLKRGEDGLVVRLIDTDSGVVDEKSHAVVGALHRETHLAALGEFEGVRQQVLQDLLYPRGVGVDRPGAVGDVRDEDDGFLLGNRLEHARHGFDEVRQAHRCRVNVDLARFDLRQIQDVVDQREQIVPGRVDRVRELHLLLGEVPALVVAEELRQDERAVQGRPELVRHVREELRLVSVGLAELVGLVLEIALRSLESVALIHEIRVRRLELFLALLELGVRGEQCVALVLQLLVGDAELFLLRL